MKKYEIFVGIGDKEPIRELVDADGYNLSDTWLEFVGKVPETDNVSVIRTYKIDYIISFGVVK